MSALCRSIGATEDVEHSVEIATLFNVEMHGLGSVEGNCQFLQTLRVAASARGCNLDRFVERLGVRPSPRASATLNTCHCHFSPRLPRIEAVARAVRLSSEPHLAGLLIQVDVQRATGAWLVAA